MAMTRLDWLLRAALVASGLAVSGGGCQVVVDAKDRKLDPAFASTPGDPAAPAGNSPVCAEYCSTVATNCTGSHTQYASPSVCLAVCARLPLGGSGATFGNSVQCRKTEAESAGNTGEPGEHCPAAGPAGNAQCGTTCESYCTLMSSICPTSFSGRDQCTFLCAGMSDLMTYDVSEQRGDTLQCRVFHVTAATQNPASHCPHAGAMPTRYCVDQSDAEPPPEAGAACELEDGDDACEICQAQHCCVEKNTCYADAICDTADIDLDHCVELAESSDAGSQDCYDRFTSTSPLATALLGCKRANCGKVCFVP